MAIQNDILFNAAHTGFFAGSLAGRDISTLSAGAITALRAAAVAFATSVDAGIAEDATITTGGGDASQLGNAALVSDIISAEQWKGTLLHSICFSAAFSRNAPAGAPASAAEIAAVIAAYTAAKTDITNAP
jgi:hypothetical protein